MHCTRLPLLAATFMLLAFLLNLPGCVQDSKEIDGPTGPELNYYLGETSPEDDSTWYMHVSMYQYGANPVLRVNDSVFSIDGDEANGFHFPRASPLILDMETDARHVVDTVNVLTARDLAEFRLNKEGMRRIT